MKKSKTGIGEFYFPEINGGIGLIAKVSWVKGQSNESFSTSYIAWYYTTLHGNHNRGGVTTQKQISQLKRGFYNHIMAAKITAEELLH